ncbi:MAG: hypothetical protein ACMG57_05755 [Candidatus Dojkabacteria bacterium]
MAEETKMEDKTPEATKQETTTTTTTTKKSGSSKTMIIVIIVIVLLCCCVSIIGGAIYFYQRAQTSTAVDILNNLGGSTPPGFLNTAPNTGSTGSDTSSLSATLPSGFPSDVPIYPSAKVLFGVKNDTDSYSASLTSTASAGAVTDFYKSEVVKQGWTIKSEGNIFGYVITAEKDTRELNVVIIDIKDDNGNPVQSITLSVTPKN